MVGGSLRFGFGQFVFRLFPVLKSLRQFCGYYTTKKSKRQVGLDTIRCAPYFIGNRGSRGY